MTRRRVPNNVRAMREEILLSKAELARKAGISPLTVDRVEAGAECRLDTKRKIILALGKRIEERAAVFPGLDAQMLDRNPDHGQDEQPFEGEAPGLEDEFASAVRRGDSRESSRRGKTAGRN